MPGAAAGWGREVSPGGETPSSCAEGRLAERLRALGGPKEAAPKGGRSAARPPGAPDPGEGWVGFMPGCCRDCGRQQVKGKAFRKQNYKAYLLCPP